MAKNILIVIIVLVALGGGAYALVTNSDKPSTNEQSSQDSADDMSGMDMSNTQNSTSSSQDQAATSTPVSASEVDIKDYAYAPATITVKKGTKVTWTNQDAVRHDITPDNESADFKASELLAKGESYSVTFNTAGTYTYYCSPHTYMKGTVIVTE